MPCFGDQLAELQGDTAQSLKSSRLDQVVIVVATDIAATSVTLRLTVVVLSGEALAVSKDSILVPVALSEDTRRHMWGRVGRTRPR